jgi:hypothetical protein
MGISRATGAQHIVLTQQPSTEAMGGLTLTSLLGADRGTGAGAGAGTTTGQQVIPHGDKKQDTHEHSGSFLLFVRVRKICAVFLNFKIYFLFQQIIQITSCKSARIISLLAPFCSIHRTLFCDRKG